MEEKLKLFKKTCKILLLNLVIIFQWPKNNKNSLIKTIELIGKLHELLYDFEKELAFIRAEGGKVYEITRGEYKKYVILVDINNSNFNYPFTRIREVKREVEEHKEEKFDPAKYWDDNRLILASIVTKDEFIKLYKKCNTEIEKIKSTTDFIQEITNIQESYDVQRAELNHIVQSFINDPKNKTEKRRNYMEGTECQVCKHCKFFHSARDNYWPAHDGFCRNIVRNNSNHCVVFNSDKDKCEHFEFK